MKRVLLAVAVGLAALAGGALMGWLIAPYARWL